MEPSRGSRDDGNHRAGDTDGGKHHAGGTMTRTALVTGASRGIGRAIAERLARDGDEVVAAIGAAGGRARALVLDVSDPQAVAAALTGVELDVLVNNAGIGVLKPFVELTADDWQRTIDVNVNALYHVTH